MAKRRKRITTKWSQYQKGRWTKESLSSGAGPNPVVMKEYKERVLSLRNGETLPDTKRKDARAVFTPGWRNFNVDPRLELELRIEEERRKASPWWETWRHVVLMSHIHESILLFWSGNTFRLIKEDHALERTYQSMFDYEGRDKALQRWRAGLVKWVHVQPIPDLRRTVRS